MSKVTPFLMFDDQLESALEFFLSAFPDSEVRHVARAGEDGPVRSAEFVVGGQTFKAFNGGPEFEFSNALSLYVDCEDQAEVDRYWERIVAADPDSVRLDRGPVRPLVADRASTVR